MVVWLLGEDGRRHRLLDPFVPTCYLAAPATLLEQAIRWLSRLSCRVTTGIVERYELGASRPLRLLEVAVHSPSQFITLTRGLIQTFPDAQFFHIDVSLPQRYFYDRQLFPLASCEAEVTKDDRILTIQPLESPWDTDYILPPLTIMELSPEGGSPNPNHGGQGSLIVHIDGDERVLEGDNADVVRRLHQLLTRHDPDVLLTDWGDSYLLPRLIAMAEQLRLPLTLNRDDDRPIGSRKAHSYFSYGRIVSHAGARTLSGRLHLDRRNSFALAETGLAGLIEQARVAKVDLQQMARTTTGTGITSMQLETACRDGVLIPYRKQEPEAFKSALELLHTDQGGLVFAPIIGYHEQVGELDFSSMYPSIMVRFNVSPETVNCRCCRDVPATRVPEIGHHTCRHRQGLVPRTLAPLLDKRARYKRLMAATSNVAARATLDQRQTALKWLLVVSFGYLGYKNARFGRIEAHESVTAYSRDILLQAKEIAERRGYRMLHAIVDSLWLVKPGAGRPEYETLAQVITEETGLPINVEGIYRWIGFLPSRVNPKMPVPNQFVGVFEHGGMKVRGIELRRSDAPLLVKRAQAEMLRCLGQARTLIELREQIPQALDIVRTYRHYLREGHATIEELAIAKSLSKEPQAYRHQTLSMIAAQELLARGVSLQAGDTIHYIITDAAAACPPDRVRAVAGLDGTWSYDATAYDILLRKAALAVLSPLGVTAKDLQQDASLPTTRSSPELPMDLDELKESKRPRRPAR
ncbi:DNA polymerase domain-containing protein [Nitrospira sp. NS4]|uniref:DNA polymerase domain-containing protein n=1 Tax=Nitrospira sp. NS4 TaxID=3414498 RepID=UPI003C2FEE7E